MFKTEADLHEHSRAALCQLRLWGPGELEFVNEAQMQRSRKKRRGQPDGVRWREMYRIIFRLGDAAGTPSPCKTLLPPPAPRVMMADENSKRLEGLPPLTSAGFTVFSLA